MTPVPVRADLPRLLEDCLDRHTLTAVLESLVAICSHKADHVREAWPATSSEPLAQRWARAAHRLDAVCDTVRKAGL